MGIRADHSDTRPNHDDVAARLAPELRLSMWTGNEVASSLHVSNLCVFRLTQSDYLAAISLRKGQ